MSGLELLIQVNFLQFVLIFQKRILDGSLGFAAGVSYSNLRHTHTLDR